jgi:hypothetical protein
VVKELSAKNTTKYAWICLKCNTTNEHLREVCK